MTHGAAAQPPAAGYDVFISHSTRTRPRAGAIVESVVGCLRRRGLSVFWDQTNLAYGAALMRTIEAAIHASRAGVIVLTREAVKSGWVEWERTMMKPLQQQRRMAIVGLRLDRDCPRVVGVRWDDLIEVGEPLDVRKLCFALTSALRKSRHSGQSNP